MNITFTQLKKYLCESVGSIYDEYEDILCDVFNVDDISQITEDDYLKIKSAYEKNKLNEHDSTLLEDAEELVLKAAEQNGYNLIAHHGTKKKFSEFKYGDIGFHVGTLEQAKIAASWHSEDKSKKTIFLNTAVRLQNPLIVEEDLGDWNPNIMVEGAALELSNIVDDALDEYADIHNRYIEIDIDDPNILKDAKKIKFIERAVKRSRPEYDHSSDEHAQFCFLYNELGYSVIDILELYYLNSADQQKKEIINRIKYMGYDGIQYLNLYEVNYENKKRDYSFIVFDANQIKNCEVISFKDGKLVPLENRFNSNTNNLFENK